MARPRQRAPAAAIVAHRAALMAGGGALKGAAAEPADTDLDAFDILVRPFVWASSGASWPRLDKPGADRR